MKGNKVISISGCGNCPFCVSNDMDVNYSCEILDSRTTDIKNQIFDCEETFTPKTPNWCPLNKHDIMVSKHNPTPNKQQTCTT